MKNDEKTLLEYKIKPKSSVMLVASGLQDVIAVQTAKRPADGEFDSEAKRAASEAAASSGWAEEPMHKKILAKGRPEVSMYIYPSFMLFSDHFKGRRHCHSWRGFHHTRTRGKSTHEPRRYEA